MSLHRQTFPKEVREEVLKYFWKESVQRYEDMLLKIGDNFSN